MKAFVLLFSLTFIPGLPLGAKEELWPGWLGPERNGRVDGFKSPAQWPAELKPKWSVKVGSGYGTPVVAKGKVLIHSRQGDKEMVRAVEIDSGKVLWAKGYPVPFKMGGGGERHGKSPKANPSYSEGRLFTTSISGILTAWDAESGKLLWRKVPGKRFGQSHAHWGASNSPLVLGDMIVNLFGNEEAGTLMALDVATGERIWSTGNDGTCYSSPFSVEIDGVRQIVAWNHRALVGVAPEDGRLLWEFPFPHKTHNQNMPTPAFHEGKILLGAENRGIHAIAPVLKKGKWSVSTSWSQKELALDMASAIVADGFLYGLSHYGQGRLFCLDPENGKMLWQGSPRTGPYASFLSFPGHVLTLSHQGRLVVFKASPNGFQFVANYTLSDSSTWAAPVLLKDGILVKDADSLSLWTLR
ncbi:MAG: PQQ-binding-like beta-propeller repeat protein [Opitutae bacterium]|jgi:outer membrane protein assembly factor BamB|nr:PQQ-binding-like beta-propeller repeat protein [Opitutae bacterium]